MKILPGVGAPLLGLNHARISINSVLSDALCPGRLTLVPARRLSPRLREASFRVAGDSLGDVVLGGGAALLEPPRRSYFRAGGLLGTVRVLPVGERGARLRHKRFCDLSAHQVELLLRRVVRLNRLLALSPFSSVHLVQGITGLLPLRGADFGVFGAPDEGRYFVAYELHRAVFNQPTHGLCGLLGCVGDAAVCAVAFHRLNELLPRLRQVVGDDV
ncbi:hypothetical protein [Leucobacter sp. GX0328]